MADIIVDNTVIAPNPVTDYIVCVQGGPSGDAVLAPMSSIVSTGTLGTKVFYCSTSGVPDDADLSLGSSTFGTDGTAAIQALIDQADANTAVTIYVDTHTSITGLDLKSNVTLIGHSGCGFILRNTSNRPIITNVEFTGTWDLVTENAHIRGLILNGNRATQDQSTPAYGYTVGVGLFGTKNCSVRDCYFTDAKMYSLLAVYSEDFVADGNRIVNPGGNIYQDGIDVVGYTKNARVTNNYVETWDDAFVFGADGLTNYDTSGDFDDEFYSGSSGQCDVYAENNTIVCTKGVRLISSVNLLNVEMKNFRGTSENYSIISDNFPGAPDAFDTPGPGNFGNIIIDGWYVERSGAAVPGAAGMMEFGGHYENLTIKNVVRKDFADNRPTIHFYDEGFSADVVNIDGYTALDNDAVTLNHIYHQHGLIGELNISNVTIKRTEINNDSALYLAESTASAPSVNFNNILVDGANMIFSSEGGTFYLSAANVRHRGVGTTEESFRTTDTIADFVLSNYYGFVPTSGTFTKTRGDGFAAGGLPTTPPAVSGLTYAYTANVLAPYASGLTIGSAAVTGFNNKGLANQHLPSATDGRIISRMYTGEGGAVVMASAVNAPVTHTALVGCGFSIAAADGSIYQHDGISATDTGLNITHGHYIAIFRNGTTGAFKLQTSPDKVSWMDLAAPAIAYNSTANIYNPIDILKAVGSPVGDGKLRNPEAQGFV